jgi:hypothetical protein
VACATSEVAQGKEVGSAGALLGALLPYLHTLEPAQCEAALQLVLSPAQPSALAAFCGAASLTGEGAEENLAAEVARRLAEVAPRLPSDVLPAACLASRVLHYGGSELHQVGAVLPSAPPALAPAARAREHPPPHVSVRQQGTIVHRARWIGPKEELNRQLGAYAARTAGMPCGQQWASRHVPVPILRLNPPHRCRASSHMHLATC